jgi:glucokinase
MGKKKSAAGGRLYGGVDIGATKLHAVVARADGTVLARARKKTKASRGFEAVLGRVRKVLEEACEDAGTTVRALAAVGVGAPSAVREDGVAVNAPNMGWRNAPLAARLAKRLGRPVAAVNDCDAGTLGEAVFGAGRGAGTLVGLFLGTGLGGGLVRRGEILRGENGIAAELGHLIVAADGRRCGCGHRGCLEAYASKTGMARRLAREIDEKGRRSVLDVDDGDYGAVGSGALARAYKDGDPVVRDVVHEAVWYLGIGVANLITLLGPDVVVLGGGFFEAFGARLLGRVRKTARAHTFPPASFDDARIVLSKLEDDAVALGAMAYAMQRGG